MISGYLYYDNLQCKNDGRPLMEKGNHIHNSPPINPNLPKHALLLVLYTSLLYSLPATWLLDSFYDKIHCLSTLTNWAITITRPLMPGLCSPLYWRHQTVQPKKWNGSPTDDYSSMTHASQDTPWTHIRSLNENIPAMGLPEKLDSNQCQPMPLGSRQMALLGLPNNARVQHTDTPQCLDNPPPTKECYPHYGTISQHWPDTTTATTAKHMQNVPPGNDSCWDHWPLELGSYCRY